MKRTVAYLFSAVLLAGLCACGKSGAASPAPSPSPTPSPAPSASPVSDDPENGSYVGTLRAGFDETLIVSDCSELGFQFQFAVSDISGMASYSDDGYQYYDEDGQGINFQFVNSAIVARAGSRYGVDGVYTFSSDSAAPPSTAGEFTQIFESQGCTVTLADGGNTIKRIQVNGQTIVPRYSEVFSKSAVYFADVNFDGSLDLLAPYEQSAHGVSFDAWLWDAEKGLYVEAPSFENIWNPVIDVADEQVLPQNDIGRCTFYDDLKPCITADPAVIAAYKAVLDGSAEFYSTDAKKNLNIGELWQTFTTEDIAFHINSFAVVDLDHGGTPEVVLYFGDYLGFEILRYQDGVVYGYTIFYRAFGEPKIDGTFSFSSGAADGGIGMIMFTKDGYSIEDINTPSDQQDSKLDVAWYSFTPEAIAAVLKNP